jgi:hypothetical protein
MTNDGGGWTLVLRGEGGSADCRTTMMTGMATADAPLDPIEAVSAIKMFSQSTIQSIKTDLGVGTTGIRFTRDDDGGAKFIPSSCEIQFGIESNSSTECQNYSLTYADTPAWSYGDMDDCSGGCNPLGTNGGAADLLESLGLYDAGNCFDSWSHGIKSDASVWVR